MAIVWLLNEASTPGFHPLSGLRAEGTCVHCKSSELQTLPSDDLLFLVLCVHPDNPAVFATSSALESSVRPNYSLVNAYVRPAVLMLTSNQLTTPPQPPG